MLFFIADGGTAHLSACYNFKESIYFADTMYYILSWWQWLQWAWYGEMIFSDGYIFAPKGHTQARNQCLEGSARAEERQADTSNKSKVAAPTLLRQDSILI
jgi:hypothetical protein